MRARGLGWLALGSCAALYVVAFATSLGRRADAGLFARVSDTDLQSVNWVGYRVLHTVDVASVCLIGVALVLVGLARGRSARAVAAAVVLLGSLATTEVVKRSLAPLDRVLAPHRGSKWEGSFPSGTATIAMALALGAVLVAPRALRLATALVGSVTRRRRAWRSSRSPGTIRATSSRASSSPRRGMRSRCSGCAHGASGPTAAS